MVETKPLLLASASLIGIFVISLYAAQVDLAFTDLDEINTDSRNSVVHVRGIVKEFKEFSVGVKLLLEQDDFRISVVYFEKISGKKNMCADVVGEVETNEGAIEIVASEVNLFIC